MRKNKDEFITFKELEHRAFLRDVFNIMLITGCFLLVSIPLFSVYSESFSHSENTVYNCIHIIAQLLYPAVGLYVPFLIYSIAKNKTVGRGFGDKGQAKPLYFVMGIFVGCGISVSLNFAGASVVTALRNAGFTVNEALPYIGDNGITKLIFIIAATLIPPFFQELALRGIVAEDIKKNSYGAAILMSGLFNCFYKSFQQIPYFFVLGLFLGWLYVKTESLVLTYTVNTASHLLMSSMWIFRNEYESLFDSFYPTAALIGVITAVIGFILLIAIYGAKLTRTDADGPGLKKGEAPKAMLKSFAFWIFIIFIIINILLGKNGTPYIHKEEDSKDTYNVSVREEER